jgi:hypothetical protein
MPPTESFPQIPNECVRFSTGMPDTHSGVRDGTPENRNKPSPSIRAGYHSRVCSNTGDAIVVAIDQLASDAQDAKAGANEGELTARVANLWQMVSDLDPELARRTRRYTGSVDGDPSA